ncbi:AraC family transcriptional regulator [Desulfoplanes formicivorans]|nr:helix-turn-helix transcriptional regulator [Desulfoplanes formicivorans]
MALPRPVVALAKDFPAGHVTSFHHHARSQLLYASSGVMTVTTDDGIWVVPPFRAIWIPARMRHQRRTSGPLSVRTLYIDPDYSSGFPQGCCVVAVSPLLKELILHVVSMPQPYPLGGPEERLVKVLLDQIHAVDLKSLRLPIPRDLRLKKIFSALLKHPGDKKTLDEWGRIVGATRRTLTRLFQSETGMSFGQWRQQIRILESLRRLAEKEPVTSVAIDLGYESPSAFISMFKKALGKTPGHYFEYG